MDHGYFVLHIINATEAAGEFTFMQKLNEKTNGILPKMKFNLVKENGGGVKFTK